MSQRRNELGVPTFDARSETASVNIADYDGKIVINALKSSFVTVWEGVSDGVVRVYNDGPQIVGVAVVRDVADWQSYSLSFLQSLNFTSRYRKLSANQVAVFEHTDGSFLVVRIRKFAFAYEDEQHLSIEFYVHAESNDFPTLNPADALGLGPEDLRNGHPRVSSQSADEARLDQYTGEVFDLYAGIQRASLRAEVAFTDLIRGYETASISGMQSLGDNQPPPDIFIDDDARTEALKAMRRLGNADNETKESLAATSELVAKIALQVGNWALLKLDKFSDSFVEGLGKSISSRTFLLSLALHFSGYAAHLAELASKLIWKI